MRTSLRSKRTGLYEVKCEYFCRLGVRVFYLSIRISIGSESGFFIDSLIELVGSSIGLHPDSGGATLLRGGSTDPCDF